MSDLASVSGNYSRMKFWSARPIADLIRSFHGSSGPVSVDGYLKKTERDDVVLFSESLRSKSWIRISTREIRELEYFGREFITNGVCAKVRLTL